jgi:RecG-like helicase
MADMAFRDLKRKFTAYVEELDTARLQDRYVGLGLTPIGEAATRVPIRVGGEVKRLQMAPRAGSPTLEVVVSDGTGEATAVFTGRRHIGGIEHGRGMLLEGVAHRERGRLIVLNPAYTLLARG